MQIICVSRGTFAGGKNLAEKLADKLGYDCLGREELTDAATRAGIPVGKLEMAVVGNRPLSESLAIEKERFKAFLTATLCERALTRGLVYHGRTGHLVLPGVGQVLRVRVIWDRDHRIASIMERLDLSWTKARKYMEDVDEDRRRWVRAFYNVDWQDPRHYDTVINLSHLGVDNAASSLVSLAQLPEFQVTPATRRAVEDLLLASRCRLAIGADERTRDTDVQVRSEHGRVSVTYLPRQERAAKHIPEVLKGMEGIDELLCTMASTNLLWVQERFDPKSEALPQILEIAGKWNAAVELVQLTERGEQAGPSLEAESGDEPVGAPPETEAEAEEHGGILDDAVAEEEAVHDEGFKETRGRLIEAGRAGGYRIVPGGPRELLASLDRTAPYSLVVVGDVFLSKAASVRKRLSREMVGYLSDNLRVPVIGAEELKTRYLFGPSQWLRLLIYGGVALLLFWLVITHQKEVLGFLSKEGRPNRILGTAALLIFVPFFAYMYGHFARYVLRLFRLE
jgi:cytidylate kinase